MFASGYTVQKRYTQKHVLACDSVRNVYCFYAVQASRLFLASMDDWEAAASSWVPTTTTLADTSEVWSEISRSEPRRIDEISEMGSNAKCSQ